MTGHAETRSIVGGVIENETLLDVFNVLLRRRRLVVTLPLATAVLTLLVAVVVPATYTARTTFVPEPGSAAQGRLPAGFAGLGGVAGLAGALSASLGGDASRSPRFYAEVAKSSDVLEKVLLTRFPTNSLRPDSASLLRILAVSGRNFADSLQRGAKKLSRRVVVRVDNQTGIVELTVDSREPRLSALVANRFVALLNEFNTHTRQSRARERRKFVEERVAEGERSLRAAEDQLKQFYEKNRSWQQAPQLVFEEGRLRRQVELNQELYLTLRREYETARIEEVNDTPIITVVDSATPPTRRSKPKLVILTTLAFILGCLIAVFSAFGVEYVNRLRHENEKEYRQSLALAETAREDLSSMIPQRGQSSSPSPST
jgi:uncharacterized protein involved in exopolysaccharide biosynthesis